MEGPQLEEKSINNEIEDGIYFGASVRDGLEDRGNHIPNSPSSSQSSQHVHKKRSFLDIVNNPMIKKDPQPQKQKRDLSNVSITSLLIDNPQSNHQISPQALEIAPSSLQVNPPHWIDHLPFSNDNNANDQSLYSNIGGSLAPFFKAAQNTAPNLPPLPSFKPPPTLPTISQSLPSLSALFGRNLLNSSNSLRYNMQLGPNQKEMENGPTAPFMLPSITDSYNPLNAPPTPQFPSPFMKQDTAQNHQQVQPQARPINGDPNNGPSSSAIRFPLTDRVNALSSGVEQNRFVLLEQPNEIQRKSYKNESRYLLPNPLTVCLRTPIGNETIPSIIDGTVNVKIINADGNDLPANMQNILESLGGLSRPLDEERSASFSLKVSATSIGSMYRLLFNVTYRVKGSGSFTESILSTPFSVCSNRKKQLKELKERLNQLQRKS